MAVKRIDDKVISDSVKYSVDKITEIVKKVSGIDDVKKLGEGTYYFAYVKKGSTADVEKDVSASTGCRCGRPRNLKSLSRLSNRGRSGGR